LREERIKSLIKTWNSKAEQETDIFSKFVFLWFCFNAWLSYESNRDNDRDMINWLKNAYNHPALCVAFENIRNSGVIDELVNLSPIRGDLSQSRQDRRSNIEIRDNQDFQNIVEALYRIRCNLFHGRKDADDERDQKLVRACANILSDWTRELIKRWSQSL